MPDNPSTELALIALLRETLDDVRALSVAVRHLEHQSQHRHQQIMTALETVVASVNANTQGQADLTTSINAAIVELGADTPTDAQLLSLATQIDANTANAAALKTALDNAVNPPVIPTP